MKYRYFIIILCILVVCIGYISNIYNRNALIENGINEYHKHIDKYKSFIVNFDEDMIKGFYNEINIYVPYFLISHIIKDEQGRKNKSSMMIFKIHVIEFSY